MMILTTTKRQRRGFVEQNFEEKIWYFFDRKNDHRFILVIKYKQEYNYNNNNNNRLSNINQI